MSKSPGVSEHHHLDATAFFVVLCVRSVGPQVLSLGLVFVCGSASRCLSWVCFAGLICVF